VIESLGSEAAFRDFWNLQMLRMTISSIFITPGRGPGIGNVMKQAASIHDGKAANVATRHRHLDER
jgi:hypothetical protein